MLVPNNETISKRIYLYLKWDKELNQKDFEKLLYSYLYDNKEITNDVFTLELVKKESDTDFICLYTELLSLCFLKFSFKITEWEIEYLEMSKVKFNLPKK